MKRALIVVVFITLCLALFLGLAFAIDIASAGSKPDAVPQSLPTATVNREPEATATVAPDYQATAQVAQANEQAAIDARLQAERAELRAEQTAEAVKLAAALVTQQAEALQVTAQAADYSAKATADANYLIRLEADTQSDVARRDAETRRKLAEAEANRAEIERQTKWVSLTFQALMVLGICVLCVAALVIAVKRREAVTIDQGADGADDPEPEEVAPVRKESHKREYPGGLRFASVLEKTRLTEAQLVTWCARMLEGAAFSNSRWTPTENQTRDGMSEGQLRALQGLMIETERADELPAGVKLNASGLMFCADVIEGRAPGMAHGEKRGDK